MTCKVCGEEIPRGKRYKSKTLTSYTFCSEECYNKYVGESFGDVESLNRLKALLETIYPIPNWSYLMKQIKHYCSEYNLNYTSMYLIIDYALTCEHHAPNSDYGLGQFIPKYIQGTVELYKQIERNRKYAEEHPDLLTPEVIRVKPHNPCTKFFTKRELGF